MIKSSIDLFRSKMAKVMMDKAVTYIDKMSTATDAQLRLRHLHRGIAWMKESIAWIPKDNDEWRNFQNEIREMRLDINQEG